MESATLDNVRPPLKWLGGKFTLLGDILPHLAPGVAASGVRFDVDKSRYIEPFLGAANVALNVPYRNMILGDANPDLPNFYNVARSRPEEFDAAVTELFTPEHNTLVEFLALRSEFNDLMGQYDPNVGHLRRATLFVYLNRHCFNGLCRYNNSGGFNAHFGGYKNPLWPEEALAAMRVRLGDASIIQADWRDIVEQAESGDVVYCDPPYLDTFSRYSKGGFGLKDHEDLANVAKSLSERGVLVAVSNSLEAESLYPTANIVHIEATRKVSRTAAGRGKKIEMLAVLRP